MSLNIVGHITQPYNFTYLLHTFQFCSAKQIKQCLYRYNSSLGQTVKAQTPLI